MSRFHRLPFIGTLSLLGLLVTAVIPLTAFEAHVINVTATIDPGIGTCQTHEVQTILYWKNHSELWILPQTIGSSTIDTVAKAAAIFTSATTNATSRVRSQLLTLKFNVAYFHVGPAHVPPGTTTIDQLIVQADNLLKKVPAATTGELITMNGRLSDFNQSSSCLVCP